MPCNNPEDSKTVAAAVALTSVGGQFGSGSLSSCGACGSSVFPGLPHTCAAPVQWRWTNPPTPAPLYTAQCCPVCEGRMTVPAGFYSHAGTATSTAPETCQACDGKGVLRVSLLGNVEQIA